MKKRGFLLSALTIGMVLTACSTLEELSGITPGSAAGDSAQASSPETEKLPPSQEYVSSDGTYKVVLLEGLSQTDTQLQAGSTMMVFDGTGFSGISLKSPKSSVPGNSGNLETLEDYADHIIGMILDGSGVTVSWEDTDAPSAEGAVQCLAREGVAKEGASKGTAFSYYAESADCYFSVFIVGNDDDIEDARKVFSLEILDVAPTQRGTRDFINGMTVALDSLNGFSLRETYKSLEDMGSDQSQLESLASQARQNLSASWDIENTADLMETADWLIYEGHNQDALDFLGEYGGTDETHRDVFDAELKEQNLDDGTYISLLAAYDAWSAYGDGAIAAWDLSRVGTVMGFGYASGYCTYEEAMDKILEAAERSQELYGSWEDFNQSYLYGYSYWSEESLEDPESSAAKRAELISSMESLANGPFYMDWDMELKKEW